MKNLVVSYKNSQFYLALIPSLRLLVHQEDLPIIPVCASISQISVGSVNFVIKALIEKGWVKAGNFSKSSNKSGYLYQLTPSGLKAKLELTRLFMLRKQREYEALKSQLSVLEEQLKVTDND